MQANGINYYKGVLLCSRPNQNPTTLKSKQFCGRVFAHEQLGLVPVKHFDEKKTKKRVLPVLNNHKKWLEHFKQQLKDQKEQQEKEIQIKQKRLEKIIQEGKEQRQKAQQSHQQAQKQPQASPVKKDANPKADAHKKKEKPAWAKTAKEHVEEQQKEVDELIDFFTNEQEAELKDYVSDSQVKSLLLELKDKIEKLKQKEDWKNQQLKRIEDRKKQDLENKGEKDDILSRISGNSQARSVASQKTAQRVEELQKKKKDVQWDKHSTTEKKTMASVDQQIAKNIADQILRNYPALKHHSNQSIRQLVEKHAHEQVKA